MKKIKKGQYILNSSSISCNISQSANSMVIIIFSLNKSTKQKQQALIVDQSVYSCFCGNLESCSRVKKVRGATLSRSASAGRRDRAFGSTLVLLTRLDKRELEFGKYDR